MSNPVSFVPSRSPIFSPLDNPNIPVYSMQKAFDDVQNKTYPATLGEVKDYVNQSLEPLKIIIHTRGDNHSMYIMPGDHGASSESNEVRILESEGRVKAINNHDKASLISHIEAFLEQKDGREITRATMRPQVPTTPLSVLNVNDPDVAQYGSNAYYIIK